MAEEKAQFHQGWLYAREDGLQFAPYTVTEGIYNQNGTLLSSDISSLKNNVVTNTNDISALKTKTEYMDASARDTFYVIDSNKNVIAMIDKDGVKSVDFVVPDVVSLATLGSRVGIQETDNTFYIVDASGNIAFQVDGSGIKGKNFVATNDFTLEGGSNLSGVASNVATNTNDIGKLNNAIGDIGLEENSVSNYIVNTVNDALEYVVLEDDSKAFHIVDPNKNLIMKVDGTGVHSINFFGRDVSNNEINLRNISDKVANNIETIAILQTKTTDITYDVDNKITTIANNLTVNGNVTIAKELDVNIVKMEDEIFYFTDASGNIIAQIDNNGVSAHRSRIGFSKMDCIAYQKMGTVTY